MCVMRIRGPWLATKDRCQMAFDDILSGTVTVLITLYLAYALWRPERF